MTSGATPSNTSDAMEFTCVFNETKGRLCTSTTFLVFVSSATTVQFPWSVVDKVEANLIRMGGKATPAVMVHLKGVTSSTQTGASTIPVKNGVYTFHGFRDVDGVLMQLLKFIAREHKMKGGSSLKGENKKSTQLEKKAELIEVEEKKGTTAGSPKRLSGGSGSHRRPRGGVAGKQDSGEPNNNKVTSSSHGSSTDAVAGGAGVDNAEQQRAAVAAQNEELRQQQEAATRNYNVGLATLLLVFCLFLFQCVLPLFGGGSRPSYLRSDALHSQDELQALYGGENAAYVVQHHVDTLVPPSLQHMRNRLGWQQCSAIGILVVCALLLGYRLGMAAPAH